MPDPLNPSAALLCKLGSIAVHVEEMLSPAGHAFDRVAMEQLLADPEVREWLAAMDALAMVPKKRTVNLAAELAKPRKRGTKHR